MKIQPLRNKRLNLGSNSIALLVILLLWECEFVRSQENAIVQANPHEWVANSRSLSPTPEMLAQSPEADRLWEEGWQLWQQGMSDEGWEQALQLVKVWSPRTVEVFKQAIEKWEAARQLYHAAGMLVQEADTLYMIGGVYENLGETQQALDSYHQLLSLRQQVGDPEGEGIALTIIGRVYNRVEEKQQALSYYDRALVLYRETGDSPEERLRQRSGEAWSLSNIGRVYSDLGEKQKALDYLNQALMLQRELNDSTGKVLVFKDIFAIYSELGEQPDRGDLNEALVAIDELLAETEDILTQIDSEDLRTSYFATVYHHYQFKINVLMLLHQQQPDKGYNITALDTNERTRARTLLALLNEANIDIRQGVDPQWLEQENQLQQQLNRIETQRLQPDATTEQLAQLDRQSNAILEQLQELIGFIRTISPAYADLQYPQPLTLPEIQQQVLDEETVLLQYALGETRSYLWVVTSTSMASYELPPAAEITDAVATLRNTITYPTSRNNREAIAQAAAPLTQMLLAPAIEQLGGQFANKRLLIVGDGALQYLPFAALPVGTENAPLIAQHEIVYLPSASVLGILRQTTQNRKLAPKQLAILADPVFGGVDDDRFSGNPSNNPDAVLQSSARDMDLALPPRRLLFSREEAREIASMFPESERLQALDFEANRQLATSDTLSQYRIVHFATHGFLNSVNPALSGLILSLANPEGTPDNGFLRLHDIFNLNLPAELVVLSACQTGLGEELRGEGLVGLTRGFMYAGAKRVAVSLWSVDDRGTSVLMSEFYRQMLEGDLSPAAALRQAQLKLLQQPDWQSPYYWAAFTMQGEW
jgi:CHAT domain-containing protein/tetratricopeptide (TPR) repeat protein